MSRFETRVRHNNYTVLYMHTCVLYVAHAYTFAVQVGATSFHTQLFIIFPIMATRCLYVHAFCEGYFFCDRERIVGACKSVVLYAVCLSYPNKFVSFMCPLYGFFVTILCTVCVNYRIVCVQCVVIHVLYMCRL